MTKPQRNIVWHDHTVDRRARELVLGQQGRLVWFTGLSGSGKSTLASLLDETLTGAGRACYLLDGDNVRHGLCRDLGFAADDRRENIRRVGEVGRLFVDSGLITIAAFISPYRSDRQMIRDLLPEGDFVEVFVDTPLEVCEQRDPKGLYERARTGEIRNFTGISAPYEAPEHPEVRVDTTTCTPEECVAQIMEHVLRKPLEA